jgi:hypothetical protein
MGGEFFHLLALFSLGSCHFFSGRLSHMVAEGHNCSWHTWPLLMLVGELHVSWEIYHHPGMPFIGPAWIMSPRGILVSCSVQDILGTEKVISTPGVIPHSQFRSLLFSINFVSTPTGLLPTMSFGMTALWCYKWMHHYLFNDILVVGRLAISSFALQQSAPYAFWLNLCRHLLYHHF